MRVHEDSQKAGKWPVTPNLSACHASWVFGYVAGRKLGRRARWPDDEVWDEAERAYRVYCVQVQEYERKQAAASETEQRSAE